MIQGLEGKLCGERLRELSVFKLEKMGRKGHHHSVSVFDKVASKPGRTITILCRTV